MAARRSEEGAHERVSAPGQGLGGTVVSSGAPAGARQRRWGGQSGPGGGREHRVLSTGREVAAVNCLFGPTLNDPKKFSNQ